MYLGIDVGSVSVKVVLMDDQIKGSAEFNSDLIKERHYLRSHGQPVDTVLSILRDLATRYPLDNISLVAITGSGGKLIAEKLNGFFVNEVMAQSTATGALHPDVKTVIEIGGEDSKLIRMTVDPATKKAKVLNFATNTVCAAGTGSFLDQQASRMRLSIEEFSQLSLKCDSPPRVAGRCSVFAKSDMIHLQQIGTPLHDIIAGLCHAMASNFRSTVVKGMIMEKPIVFQGGVAANQGMVQAFTKVLELEQGELVLPEDFALMGAIGAVLSALNQGVTTQSVDFIKNLEDYLRNRTIEVESLEQLQGDGYAINVEPVKITSAKKIEAFVGVDVGSISTNVVVVDRNKNVLSRRYLMTAGQPLEAVKRALYEVGQEIGDKIIVKGCGSTGSGRYMTGEFFGADMVKNEITSHACGSMAMDPTIDTILEIGGQDSKYISLANGVIVDFTMNKVCAAGTGSFLEEQAEKLAVQLDQEFGQRALRAQCPTGLGERCTVFMESQLNFYKQQGLDKDNLLGGLAYSIVTNYLNRVVEHRKIGERIFFQGGVAFNRSIKAAFEKVLGKKIMVPPHHDILGAVGAAIIAMEEIGDRPTRFKGFDLRDRKYETRSFECKTCPNFCEIRKVTFESTRPLFYGSRCGKYDDPETKKAKEAIPVPRLVREREQQLFGNSESGMRHAELPKVGIPRILMTFELYPLWRTFFENLGLEVVLSSSTNRSLIKSGVEHVVAEPCFPIKAAHGHLLELLDKKVDYLFFPVMVNMPSLAKEFDRSYLCPYVQALPFTAKSGIPFEKYPTKVLRPIFHMDRGQEAVGRILSQTAREMGVRDSTKIQAALAKAFAGQKRFDDWRLARGAEVLKNLKADERAVIVISRPYNGCDPGINLNLPERLRELGVVAIPIDMVPLHGVTAEVAEEYPYMYWKSGQRILGAARLIARDPRLFGIYLTNFGCGPDSYIAKFFEKEMAGKPYLTIEIDEHSADAGMMTRVEAFLDTIRHASKLGTKEPVLAGDYDPARENGRTIYLPYMDDHGVAIAAAMRANGIPAESLPISDEKSLELGRRHTSGKECLPSITTTGDILKKTMEPGFDPDRSAFFMPSAKGPCRFGQYNKLHRMILDKVGLKTVPMMLFDQTDGYHKDMSSLGSARFKRLAWRGITMTDLMQKLSRQIRPYEVNAGETDRVYQHGLKKLGKVIEKESDLTAFARSIRKEFDQIKVDTSKRKPKIGIIGEIYVRSNPFTNNNLIQKLEKLGAEAASPPLEEWVDYIDHIRKEDYFKDKDYKHWLIQCLTEFIQEYDANKLRKVFKGAIKDFYLEAPAKEVVQCGQTYIDQAIKGESILSMGRAVEYVEKKYNGIINVIPFGCMPGNVVDALLRKFRDDHHGIPTLTLTVDGIKDPAEDMRIEAFVNQVRDHLASASDAE